MNTLYELAPYDISLRYAYLLNILFSTAFYAPVIPICMIYSLVAFLLMYWADKYTILRRRSISSALGV